MTFARKLKLKLILLTVSLFFASGAVVVGLLSLRHFAQVAHEEFLELQQIQQAHRFLVQAIVDLGQSEVDSAGAQLQKARAYMTEFEDYQDSSESSLDKMHAEMETRSMADALVQMDRSVHALRTNSTDSVSSAIEHVGLAMKSLVELSSRLDQTISRTQDQSIVELESAAWRLGGLFAVVLLAACIVNVLHYRSIMRPLRYIQLGARRLASGDMQVRLTRTFDTEFQQLQEDFNQMARELASLYHNLEERIAVKSKELAISERRASMGYLAAGVAHEVNNPLGIITGHAESLMRRLRHAASSGEPSQADLVDALEIIRDESFRCKKIIQGLLDLSQMGDDHRDPVSLLQISDDVVHLVGASPAGRNRRLRLTVESDDRLQVMGSSPELKQVVLNLVINALQSVSEGSGEVELIAHRDNGWVQLDVCDNGCGIGQSELEKVFEPFYTQGKEHAYGLGLSISQAIVERHGGMIVAHSDGANRGSRFTVRLPGLGGDVS